MARDTGWQSHEEVSVVAERQASPGGSQVTFQSDSAPIRRAG